MKSSLHSSGRPNERSENFTKDRCLKRARLTVLVNKYQQCRVCVTAHGVSHQTLHVAIGQHILHFGSKFRYCECDNYFAIGKKTTHAAKTF